MRKLLRVAGVLVAVWLVLLLVFDAIYGGKLGATDRRSARGVAPGHRDDREQ